LCTYAKKKKQQEQWKREEVRHSREKEGKEEKEGEDPLTYMFFLIKSIQSAHCVCVHVSWVSKNKTTRQEKQESKGKQDETGVVIK